MFSGPWYERLETSVLWSSPWNVTSRPSTQLLIASTTATGWLEWVWSCRGFSDSALLASQHTCGPNPDSARWP